MVDQEVNLALNEESSTTPPLPFEDHDNNQKIIDDYYAFFTGKKVDMLPYVYMGSSQAYNDLIHSTEYYLFRDEVNVIAHNKDALKKHLAGVTDIIEIGPGCDYTVENKTIPILDCAADLKRYHAVDYSESYLHEACNSVLIRRRDIEVSGIKADLMNGKIDITTASGNRKCVLFLGSTLGNFTESQQLYAINQIANMTNPEDILILGVDTNTDHESILKAYNYSDSSSYNFIVGVVNYYTKVDNEFKKYQEPFEIKSEWCQEKNLIKFFLISNYDILMKFKAHNTLSIKKGCKFKIGSSKKFRTNEIFDLLNNKFDIMNILSYSDRMKIYVCKRTCL